MDKNGIKFDKNKIAERKLDYEKQVREIIIDIFESKNKCKMEDSPLGRFIMGSYNFMLYDEIDFDKPLYSVNFADTDSVRINITNGNAINGVSQMIIKSKGKNAKYIDDTELQAELAADLGVDNVVISGWHWRDKDHVVVTLMDAEYILGIDQLDSFDHEKEYKKLKARVNDYNQKIDLKASQEDER